MLRIRVLVFAVLAGTAILATPYRASASTTLTIPALNGSTFQGQGVTVYFTGETGGIDVYTGEFQATVTNNSHATTIYTFCVDLSDQIQPPTTYAVNVTATNAANASSPFESLANGNAAAYIYNKYAPTAGSSFISGNTNVPAAGTGLAETLDAPDMSTALQLAIWSLVGQPLNFTYKTSDVSTAIQNAVTDLVAIGKANTGSPGQWLAEIGHDGQSFLYPGGGPVIPNVSTPAPSSLTLAFSAIACAFAFGHWRRRQIAACDA
jgi:hypothetical protein